MVDMKDLEIHTDGACSGNPGLASIAFIIKEGGNTIKEFSQSIGESTNNVAEYTAVVYALQEALILKADTVKLFSDSELLCHQLNGEYKVKNENIKPLFEQIKHLAKGFKKLSVRHIPREKNKEADGLAKKIIKQEQAKVVALFPDGNGEESPSSKG